MPPVGPVARARTSRLVAGLGSMPDARKAWDGRPVRVRALVAACGMPQEEVAARLGLGVRTLRRYMTDGDQGIGYGDLCNLERLAVLAMRSAAAAEGRRRRKAAGLNMLDGKGAEG